MGMKHYLVGSCLALSLAIAACQPAGNGTDMPGTDDMVGTDTFGTATSSGSGSGDLLTETPMGTDVMTGTVTADATETEPMMTATAAMTATSAMTGTAVMTTTAVMTGTQTPVSGEAQFIRGADLIGMEVADTSGTSLGTVDEILADQDGKVVYLLLNYNAMALTERTLIALPWADFSLGQADEMLAYSGTATDLDTMQAVNQDDFDAPGFMWNNPITGTTGITGTGSTTSTTSMDDGYIRLGRFTDFDLRNNEDEDLGEVDDLVFDLQSGTVTHALVNFGGFLGIGEKTIVVPWSQFTVEQTADDQDVLRLNVTKEDLEAAPGVDNVDEILPAWPEQITSNWADGLTDFWDSITR